MTREQQRATQAFADVSSIKEEDKEKQKRYATVVYQSIVLIRTAGLLQALEFIHSLSDIGKQEAGKKLLDSLGRQMNRFDHEIKDGHSLRKYVREAKLQSYLLLTREVMAAMVWYKRFVQSILKIDSKEALQSDSF